VMSAEVSYDVYVKDGVDSMGRDDFGEAVAHFVERENAVALKRRLEARGETVHVERSVVHGLSEAEKERRFSDYFRVPEFEPPLAQQVAQEPSEPTAAPWGASEKAEPRSTAESAQEDVERPWWGRRMFGG
jgi:hypothetical protein